MKVIGITGQVGSGKSLVCKILSEQFNAKKLIADEIAKHLMKKDNVSYKKIVDFFGTIILDDNKEIDRKKLGKIVFSNKEKLEKLNSFTHPYVKQYICEQIDICKNENKYDLIVIETAILIEVGYKEICDEVWYVCVDDKVRRERLKADRGYTEEQIQAILSNQLSDQELKKHCTNVIYNNGEVEEIIRQIQFALKNK